MLPPETSVYKRTKVITLPIVLGIIIFCLAVYFLKPTDIQIAEFYISESAYHKAIEYYETALNKEKDQLLRRYILANMSHIYRLIGELEAYERTVTKYYQEGGRDRSLLKGGLDAALEIWRRNPKSLQSQGRVIFWAGVLGETEFVKKFYIWNGRFKDFLALCEKDWQGGKLSLADIEETVKVALWKGTRDQRLIWLERYFMAGGKKEVLRKQLAEIYLAAKQYQKALEVLKKSRFPKKDLLLAQAYFGLGNKEKTANVYLRLYHHTKKKSFLEKAYLTMVEVYPNRAKTLLGLLKTYKPEYALALASSEVKRGNREKALELYVLVWDKWHRFSALKMAYALGFQLKKRRLCKRLRSEMFACLREQER